MPRSLILAAPLALATFSAAADTALRYATIEVCEGLLDDVPYSERRYVERLGDARPTLVLVLSNPSENGVGVSVYWPGEDVATGREIIGRCVEL